MMNTLRLVSRQNLHGQFRQFHKCIIQQTELNAAATTQAVSPPPSPSNSISVNPKIDRIANDITALNLIEVAELSELLKKRLNLPDVPVAPIGGFAVASQSVEEEMQSKNVQTAFSVKVTSFDEKNKVALIKEIKKLMPDMNMVQAKKFIETNPVMVKKDISKDEAEKLKETLTSVGAVVEII
ncbi:hypothetical protein HN011_011616 [Eciton burchellii]|nr:hypothetical protein HN011_011616 [Eciton burchellii]